MGVYVYSSMLVACTWVHIVINITMNCSGLSLHVPEYNTGLSIKYPETPSSVFYILLSALMFCSFTSFVCIHLQMSLCRSHQEE
jgi:hypothetical protein